MTDQTHSTVREGILVGLTGAVAAALWYLVTDMFAGTPLRTPNTLGQIFIQADSTPSPNTIRASAVAGYMVVHFLSFAVIGVVITWLVHLVMRERSLRMGLWLGLVLGFTALFISTYLLTPASGYRAPGWSTVGAAVVGSLALVFILWRRHPQLRDSPGEPPLGSDEGGSPGAPRGQMTDRPRRTL
jgi:uncharacterized membrane protein YeaQ/YmgE (transglycosylase-associated protein family)